MPTITKITIQKKNKDRYNIYTDSEHGETYAFSVDEDVLIKYNMKKGKEIDSFLIGEIQFQDEIRKAYNTAIHYLSSRMRSESEVRTHLIKKEYAVELIDEVIHKLYQYQFLNDEEFAIAFVRTQKNTTDKGPNIIKHELKDKGIAENIIQDVIELYPKEEQVETAISLCQKYTLKYKKDSSRMMQQKIEQMLTRKGFSYDMIQLALEEIQLEKDDDEEMGALKRQAEKISRKYNHEEPFIYEQKLKQALFRKGFPLHLIDAYLKENKDV
ncbi:recombination regulator RecX [Cytobacillus kochii]